MKITDILRGLMKKTKLLFARATAGKGLFTQRSGGGRVPVTGLRIGDNFLEWTALRETKAGVEILASNNAVLPAASGNQPEIEAREEQIRLSCAGISGAVALGIAPDKMLMRVAELPTTDPAEMISMIKLQVDAFSPFADDRIYVAHEILALDEKGVRVLIAAIQKEQAESAGLVLKKAGLDIQRIDAVAMAWWLLLAENAPPPDDGRYLILVLEPWGGVWIAVHQKIPLAFRAVSSPGDLPIDEYLREIARDAAAFLLSIDMEHGSLPLAGLDVWCRGAAGETLSAALSAELQHPATIHALDVLPPVSEGLARRVHGTNLTPALTRAKGGRAVLDLVPESWRATVIAQRTRRRLLAATVGVLAVWLAAMAAFFGAYEYQKYRLASLENKLNELQKPAEEVRQMQNQAKSFEQYLDRNSSALECLREVSQNLSKDVLLTSFQFKKGKNVVIRGEALAVNAIYDYKQVLDKSQLFGKIELGNIQPGKRKATTVQTFQMTCKIKERP